ncbi:MAG TPA: PIN domain-containing protein [Burkholderiales bacterium]|nr:PIN domain-containing protein [Burkholderiales bacterium]
MITLDTSAVFALANRRDPQHARAKALFLADRGPHLVPAGILAEVGYLLEARLSATAVLRFLESLAADLTLHGGEDDLVRVGELVARYADLPLGLADACVVACAERHGGAVLAFDDHFRIVAREGKLRVLPD